MILKIIFLLVACQYFFLLFKIIPNLSGEKYENQSKIVYVLCHEKLFLRWNKCFSSVGLLTRAITFNY